MGHMIPFMFTKYAALHFFDRILTWLARWLQDVFGVPLVVQLTGTPTLFLIRL
jgi:hypothetical protein